MALHEHPCRYCNKPFVCGEDAHLCFTETIVCDGCFWTIEIKYIVIVAVLAIAFIGLILFALKTPRPVKPDSTIHAGSRR